MQQLFSLRHFVQFLYLSPLELPGQGRDCCHLSAGEIPAVKGELWFENWHSQHLDISLLRLPSQGKVDFGYSTVYSG